MEAEQLSVCVPRRCFPCFLLLARLPIGDLVGRSYSGDPPTTVMRAPADVLQPLGRGVSVRYHL